MSEPDKKPSSRAGRRIRWLMAAVIVAVLAYSAGWFWFAGQVGEAVETAAGDDTGAVAFACAGQRVRGFPFRIGVFCDALDVATADGRLTLSGGPVRSAAQVYDPRRIVAEFDAPVTVTDRESGLRAQLGWSAGRAVAVTAPVADRMVSITARDLVVEIGTQQALAAEEIGLYARRQNGAVDLAARPREMTIAPALVGGRDLPAFGMDIDIRLAEFDTDWAAGPVPAGSGTVNRLSVLLGEDSGVIVEGPFSLSPQGELSGEFDVRIVDLPAVLAAGWAAFPEYAGQIETLAAAAPPGDGDAGDELDLRLTVREGRVFAGIVPLGRIPPLPLAGLSGV